MAEVLNETKPLARAYVVKSSALRNSSSTNTDGSSYAYKRVEDASYKYLLDNFGRANLVQRTTLSVDPSYTAETGVNPPPSVDYFKFYYSDNSVVIASFKENDNGSGKKLYLYGVNSIKLGSSSTELITENLGFDVYGENAGQLSWASANRAVATESGLQLYSYNTPNNYKFSGSNYNFNAKSDVLTVRVDSKQGNLTYEVDGPDGEFLSGSGLINFKDRGLNFSATGKGDPKRPSRQDGVYTTSSSIDGKFTPFSGAVSTLMQWIQNDSLLVNQPGSSGAAFESFVVNSILKRKPFAFRAVTTKNSEKRSDGTFYDNSYEATVDPLTGLVNKSLTRYNSSSRDYETKKISSYSSTDAYDNVYAPSLDSPHRLGAAEVLDLDSKLSVLLDQGKATISRYNPGTWASSGGFLFPNLV